MQLLYRGEQFDANFYYHAGIDIDHSFLLIGKNGKTLLVSRLNESLARSRFAGHVSVYEDAAKDLAGVVRGKSVLFDAASMSARMAGRLGKLCRLKDHSQEFLLMRAVKKPHEVECIRKAAGYTKHIFDSLDFESAKTELDLKRQLLLKTFELGLEPAFEPIVASGRNASFPHYCAGKKRLGSPILVDYGVKYEHYCSDLTRCFIPDGDSKKKDQYERLQGICHSIVDALPSLHCGKDVGRLAEGLMAKAGFPKMIHAIGHGIGLDVHEFPRLGRKYEDSLAGATLALEPAFYLKNYGLRYEETISFDGKRARIL